MHRFGTLLILAAVTLSLPLCAQDAIQRMPTTADPAFEVATIKAADPDNPGKDFDFESRIFHAVNYNVEDLIALGYSYQAKQIVNEPPWFATKLYDIQGIPDTAGLPTMEQKFAMIRKLLADRFQLRFHLEQRTMPCYVITVVKGGPHLTASDSDPDELGYFRWQGRLGDLRISHLTIPEFTVWFQKTVTDKPLLNRTNLSGRYSFTLVWSPGASEFPQFRRTGGFAVAADAAESAKLPNLYRAFEEQLGLRLESTRAPVDIMVIDHAEKPSPN